MLMPTLFTRNFFDDAFDPFYHGHRAENSNGLMRTDIKETNTGYELAIDMPGVKKEDLKAELKDGYLTVSAVTNKSNDQKDEEGTYICRERYYGSFSRSFYVGSEVTQEDIKATFENGTLKLTVPKKEALPQHEENHYIAIEG